MKPDEYIEFNGQRYPLFEISIVDQEDKESAENMETIEVTVSVESLSKQLINPANGMPVNQEAESIDDDIFFYIPDELADKDADEIADYVSDNCW